MARANFGAVLQRKSIAMAPAIVGSRELSTHDRRPQTPDILGPAMPPATDTTPEADAMQFAVYRRMSDARRLELSLQMSDEARLITAAGIRAHHPEYTAEHVEDALRLMLLGPRLFHLAWPDKPLLSP